MKPDYKPVIVIPAFKRAESLKKLLITLNQAIYPSNDHHLVLSLEGNSTDAVKKTARDFSFRHGSVEIVESEKQLGLKQHIHRCATLSKVYDSIILLEDDLTVSPLYYIYALKALDAYGESEVVAGISLYAQSFNETAQLPFVPMQTYDAAYFIQLASSWGVVWSADQWNSYETWRNQYLNSAREKLMVTLPYNIQKWPDSSWKKEFNLYLVSQNRYFSYPYISLTSNSSHYEGENMRGTGSLFEVPLLTGTKRTNIPVFPDEVDPKISYDMYMEATGSFLYDLTGYPPAEIEMDLYGTKPPYLLSRKSHFITSRLPDNPIAAYPLQQLPLELNIDKAYPQTDIPFFYLSPASEGTKQLRLNRWGYARMASLLGTNRIETKQFLSKSVLNFIRSKVRW